MTTTSIYHFFKFLIEHKHKLKEIPNIEKFDFDTKFISARNTGIFPDLAIKINVDGDKLFEGGELLEFKGSQTFSVSSFNSTIPTGKKAICDIVDKSKCMRKQMEQAGDNVDSMPIRDVYYLVSGKKNDTMKIVLVHGSFFETIPVKELIRRAFSKILQDVNPKMSKNKLFKLSSLFTDQKLFSQVRLIEQASVKIRFRIMTEAETNANLLSHNIYPEVKTNTINLCIPYKNQDEKDTIIQRFNKVFTQKFTVIDFKHKINDSDFLLFQTDL